ncbi:fungal-specific transcription factor domain protein [Ustulina deusta]|nr:fungal-specific transcription factor domain protein [Ustulina deusta]
MQDRIDQLENLVLGLLHQTAPSSGDHRAHLGPSPSEMDSERAIIAGSETPRDVLLTPSDHGSIRIQQTVVNYVSSSHWAAPLASFPKPQLFYCRLMYETPASIIKSLPPRPVVDRLVSRYFNVLDIAPGVVHSSHFLRELQQSFLGPTKASPALGSGASSQAAESQVTVDRYREKAIQCLILGHYTKGGPYVLETLILYFLVECFHVKDMEIGIWVLVGNIVQIAIHMGYHRDARHFPNISPLAGEMRRRVWAMIVQLDFSISTQLGLPRLVKESQTNTAEPRNLYDSDFDEHTAELPASRLKWDGLASSLNVPSQTIIQRIWLVVMAQQLKIVLHRKFIEPSRLHEEYGSSSRWRVSSAFVNDFLLATSILCFCLQNHTDKQKEQLDNSRDIEGEQEDVKKIRQSLKTSQVIWSRQCASSREARKAAAALRYVLGDSGARSKPHAPEDVLPAPFPAAAVSYFPDRSHASLASLWSFSDFMPEYDFSSLELDRANEETAWPVFTTTRNNDAEYWPGVTGSQEMDLSS